MEGVWAVAIWDPEEQGSELWKSEIPPFTELLDERSPGKLF